MKPFAIVFAILSAFVLSANAADTFKVDPVHTFVLFSVQHLGIANTYGRFNDISGTVVFDKDNPSKNSVELSVPVESLDTHNSIRERSLKSPDFFDAKQFPTMTFKSTNIEGSGDTLKVSGDLTIHGGTCPHSRLVASPAAQRHALAVLVRRHRDHRGDSECIR